MSTNRNSNGNGWKKFWIILSTCITTGGIGFGFHCLRENKKTREAKKRADYFYQKKAEDRQKRHEEEQTAQEAAQRQAEEDLEVKLNQKDKEVKNYVIRTLGLDSEETLQRERVCPSDPATKRKRLPLVGDLVSRGDLGLLVSKPGVGKSILAFQIADDIAEGRESKLFHTPQGHQPPQIVYYMDAEMNSDDIGERYPNGLSANLIRVPINRPRRNVYYLLKDITEILSLENITSDKSLVIDNIAAAAFGIDVKTLLAGLKSIQAMFEKNGFRLTVIVVVHTTKETKNRPELEDVAGSADLTRLTTKVLFLNPTEHEGVVRINDGKHRATKKNKDSILVIRGGVGTDENLHFEAAENVMSDEELQKLMDELDGNAPRKPGAPQKLTDEQVEEIMERLDAGEKVEELADEYKVSIYTINSRINKLKRKKK